jgi:hypothetical protein
MAGKSQFVKQKLSRSGAIGVMHPSNDSWELSRLPSRRASEGAGSVHIPEPGILLSESLLVPYSRSFSYH